MAAVSAPAAANDLDTLKVGLLGSLKKGVNWQPPPLPPDENPLVPMTRGIADTRAANPLTKGKETYANRLYTDYKIDQVEKAGFKNAAENPIVSIDQVPTEEKPARFYGKIPADALKTFDSFQTSLKDLRRSQFTKKLAVKQAANKKSWNALQKGLTTQTQAELDAMTKIYVDKKDELQKRLQATFEEQKRQFLINREHNVQGAVTKYMAEDPKRIRPKLAGPSGPRADVNLPGALEKEGVSVISSLPKARETRKRHRFIHLLVMPGAKPPEKDEWYGEGNAAQPFTTSSENDDPWAGVNVPPLPPVPGAKVSNTPPGSPTLSTPTPPAGGGKRKTKRKPRGN